MRFGKRHWICLYIFQNRKSYTSYFLGFGRFSFVGGSWGIRVRVGPCLTVGTQTCSCSICHTDILKMTVAFRMDWCQKERFAYPLCLVTQRRLQNYKGLAAFRDTLDGLPWTITLSLDFIQRYRPSVLQNGSTPDSTMTVSRLLFFVLFILSIAAGQEERKGQIMSTGETPLEYIDRKVKTHDVSSFFS